MTINRNTTAPAKPNIGSKSMFVFIYYANNKRFCLGYYDFIIEKWLDSDGMIISEDFIWCYLPVKQMKAYLQFMNDGSMSIKQFNIEGHNYRMLNLDVHGKRVNVATYALEAKLQEMDEKGKYEEVEYIDKKYNYSLPEDLDDTNVETIRQYMIDNFGL